MNASTSSFGGSEQTVPVCFRHPGRETWVSCARCERHICPDCMVAASVGFQCPECVREGRKASAAAVTAFGGTADAKGQEGLVTRLLIAINVAVWLTGIAVALLRGEVQGDQLGRLILTGGLTDLTQWGAALPAISDNGQLSGGIAAGEVWRLATAMFLHYSVIHLALNMYGLWLIGQHCEYLLGRWRYLGLYVVSGLGGTVAEFMFRGPNTYPIGASGCIFGLMAALFFFFRKMKIDVRPIVTLLALNLFLGFFLANISVLAHIAGAVTGGILGALFAYVPPGRRRVLTQVTGMALIVIVLAGLTAARIAHYGIWGVQ
ncbi:MAG: rhomboid family intramembrane serine protease [Mycobacteriales bacterium]